MLSTVTEEQIRQCKTFWVFDEYSHKIISQNDLKRLMDIASSMQSDIEELQNNFTSGATDLGLKDKN